MTWAYYNEIDAYPAQWLRNLIAAGHIPDGEVDERSITEVQADDLEGFAQCHFFAGIGGWAYACRLAGIPNDFPLWTGSCPCQPLSSAGQRKGHADERHLWPAFHTLIAERRPATVFGEQVASKDGREWLAGVRADLEHLGYACGCCDLPAASVGAPHIRQRLWWVAKSAGAGLAFVRGRPQSDQHEAAERAGPDGRLGLWWVAHGRRPRRQQDSRGAFCDERPDGRQQDGDHQPSGDGADGRLAQSDGRHASSEGLQRGRQHRQQPQDGGAVGLGHTQRDGGRADQPRRRQERRTVNSGVAEGLGNAAHHGRPEECQDARGCLEGSGQEGRQQRPWDDCRLIPCADGKARRVGTGIQPLAHGVSARVGKLRAAGNAIVPQVAAEFMIAALEDRP